MGSLGKVPLQSRFLDQADHVTTCHCCTAFTQAAVNAAENAGILFVASAGNDRHNNDVTEHYPSNLNSSVLLAVAASDRQDNLWGDTNYGKTTVHVAAPGAHISNLALMAGPFRGYTYMTGTSMATPHVSGTAALMLQK